MKFIYVIAFFSVWTGLSGCATTGPSPAELQHCQNRVHALEGELQRREQVIAELEDELSRAQSSDYRKIGTSSTKGDLVLPAPIQIQRALKNAGYYTGPVDGKIGAKTQDAVRRFQKDRGLKVDGKVGAMTWRELRKHQ